MVSVGSKGEVEVFKGFPVSFREVSEGVLQALMLAVGVRFKAIQ